MGHCVVTDPAWTGAARPRPRATQGSVHCQTKPVRSRPAPRGALGSGAAPGASTADAGTVVMDALPQTFQVALGMGDRERSTRGCPLIEPSWRNLITSPCAAIERDQVLAISTPLSNKCSGTSVTLKITFLGWAMSAPLHQKTQQYKYASLLHRDLILDWAISRATVIRMSSAYAR